MRNKTQKIVFLNCNSGYELEGKICNFAETHHIENIACYTYGSGNYVHHCCFIIYTDD